MLPEGEPGAKEPVVPSARRTTSRIANRMIAGSLMLSVWLAGLVPVAPAMIGMTHSPAAAHGAMAGHRGQAALMCDRSEKRDSCAHCAAGACLTMQGCSASGCLVLYQAPAPGGRTAAGRCGSILSVRALWRTRSLAPPTRPPLAIHEPAGVSA